MMFALFQSATPVIQRLCTPSFTRTLSTSPPSRTKALRFYRLLLLQCQELDQVSIEHRFLLRPNIVQQHEGMFSLSHNQEATTDDVMHEFRRRQAAQHATPTQPPKYSVRVIKVDSHDALATKKDNSSTDKNESGGETLVEADEDSDSDEEVVASNSIPTKPTSAFPPSLWCRPVPILKESIREGFRKPPTAPRKDELFTVYQYIAQQQRLWDRTSVSIEHNVRITAVAAPLPRTTVPSTSRLDRFGYRIRVENLHATDTVQLLGRSWVIAYTPSDLTTPICVEAPTGGCVGQFPKIEPGCVFEYQSAAEADQQGSMEGELFFLSKERGKFTVPVGKFELLADTFVN